VQAYADADLPLPPHHVPQRRSQQEHGGKAEQLPDVVQPKEQPAQERRPPAAARESRQQVAAKVQLFYLRQGHPRQGQLQGKGRQQRALGVGLVCCSAHSAFCPRPTSPRAGWADPPAGPPAERPVEGVAAPIEQRLERQESRRRQCPRQDVEQERFEQRVLWKIRCRHWSSPIWGSPPLDQVAKPGINPESALQVSVDYGDRVGTQIAVISLSPRLEGSWGSFR